MKKSLFLLACIFTSMLAHAKVFEDTPAIISVNELSSERLQELIYSKSLGFIIELREGTTIPLQFLTKFSFFSMMLDPNLAFRIEKTCYFRVVNGKGYISEDLVNWKKIDQYFLKGKESILCKPSTNKPGYTLEVSVTPSDDVEMEEQD